MNLDDFSKDLLNNIDKYDENLIKEQIIDFTKQVLEAHMNSESIKVARGVCKKMRRRQLPTDECDPEQCNPANVCHVCPMFVCGIPFFQILLFMHTHTDLFLSFNFCRQKKRKRKTQKRKTGRKKDDLQPPTSVCKALYLSSTPAN